MKPFFSAHAIIAGYTRDLPIVNHGSVEVSRGEVVTIVGPNGAGKSTFLKALVGLVPFSQGKVILDERDLSSLPTAARITAGIGFVPQTENIFSTLTIHENLRIGGHLLRAQLNERIDTIYSMFPMLAERRHLLAATLSGGQRQILAISRALLMRPQLIMLDEPTAGLSPKATAETLASLRVLANDGIGVLIVEQNVKAALRASDRAYVFINGHAALSDSAAGLLNNREIGALFLGAEDR